MTVPFARIIYPGDIGTDVTAVKRALIKSGKGTGIVVDPVMGDVAVKNLKAFQVMCKVSADGVYGPATHAYLSPYFDAYGIALMKQEAEALLYLDPYRDVWALAFAGYDQGVDFGGSGKVYACGPAEITVATSHSGWPGGGAVGYTFTLGKAKGKSVYLAENITPLVHVGQQVTANTAIAVMHAAYPHTESGWAQAGTDNPMSQPISHSPTYFGCNYGAFLRSIGNKHCPVQSGSSGTPLPRGWPDWSANV